MFETIRFIQLASRASQRKSKPPERLLLDSQIYGMRSSPRLGNRRVAERNGTLSEPSTSRRASRSETHSTPNPSETPILPKRRRITDYMNRVSINAQPGVKEKARGQGGARLPTNGLNTPTEGSSPDIDGHPQASYQGPAQETEFSSASLNSRALNDYKYPWSNDPIAVAIWVIQKVQNAKLLVSPAPTCAISSRQASRSTTPRASETSMYVNGISTIDNGTIENAGRRTSRRLKQPDPFKNTGCSLRSRASTLETAGQSKPEAGENRTGIGFGSTGSFDQLMQRVVKEVAPKIKNFRPFAPGYGDMYFDSEVKKRRSLSKDTIAAGKLFFNVLPALQTPESSRKFQAAADALIHLVESETSGSPRCSEAIEVISQDPELLLGTSIITAQSCVIELFLDIDASGQGASEQHNNNPSPSPNSYDEVNTTPSTVYKTNNNLSKPNLTVDSLASSLETHNPSLPSPLQNNHSSFLSSQPSQPAPSSPSHLTSTHLASTHSSTYPTSSQLASSQLASTHPPSTHTTSTHLASCNPPSPTPRGYHCPSQSSTLPTQPSKNSSSLSVTSRNQSPVHPTSSSSSFQTPPDNQSHSCSVPVQEHCSVYPTPSFNSSYQTPLAKNSQACSPTLVDSSSRNIHEKRRLVCSPSNQDHSSTLPSPNPLLEKHRLVNTRLSTDPSSSHPPYHSSLKNTSEKHSLVSTALNQDHCLTHPHSDSSLQTPSQTYWPADSLATSTSSLQKEPDKHRVVSSSIKDIRRSHPLSNTTPKHSLVNSTSTRDSTLTHTYSNTSTPEKHSPVNSALTHTHPLHCDLPQIHSLVNSVRADTHPLYHNSPFKIPSPVDSPSIRDLGSPHSPPINSSLQKTTEKQPTPLDNSPPDHNQEPSSPSESTEKMVRSSTRTRKPTERALEAAATVSASRRTAKKPAPKKAAAAPVKEEAGTKPSKDEVLVARLLELASAAVAPGFTPEQEVNVDELRKEFYSNLAREGDGQGSEAAGRASTSDGSGVARGPAVLDHPTIDRPWTDADGWTHTGQLNEHGEEFVLVPNTYVWYRPNNTLSDPLLPPPPPRMKSVAQIERDRVFGFPPLLGERNLPEGDPRPRKRSREDMEAGQQPPAADDGGARKKPKTANAAPASTATTTTTTTAAANSVLTEDTNSAPSSTTTPAPAPAATNATASKRGARSRAPKKERPAPSRASTRTRAARRDKNDKV